MFTSPYTRARVKCPGWSQRDDLTPSPSPARRGERVTPVSHRSAQKHVFCSDSVKNERVEPPEGANSPASRAPERSSRDELGSVTVEHPFLGTPMGWGAVGIKGRRRSRCSRRAAAHGRLRRSAGQLVPP